MTHFFKVFPILLMATSAGALMAQTTPGAPPQAGTVETGANGEVAGDPQVDPSELLTQAELENLVAPIALYPDTLLVQVLVAATYPLEIVKADRFLATTTETDPDALAAAIQTEGYDPSVAVLATAFPDVLSDMASHVEWTETMGTAMLAQNDDVMRAIQTMRQQAINTGALISGSAQTVETVDQEVVITPTDPEVVYVPQYDTRVVYDDNNIGNAIMSGVIVFGTFALIDEIFDDDDDWFGYWGCRNCGGWGGRPIINSPNIDIDVDGNVNIGNTVNVGGRPNVGWKPEPKRKQEAQQKIAAKRGGTGATKLPINKAETRGDSLRTQITSKTGVSDISKTPAGKLPTVNRPSTRPAPTKKNAIAKTATRPAGPKAAAVHKPSVKKPAVKKATAKPATKAVARKPSAMARQAPAHKSRAASSRGKASGGKLKGRR